MRRTLSVMHRRRRLLEQLLVSTLDRALALAQVHDGAVMIAEDLELDVARRLEVALDVDVAVAEGRLGLALGGAQRVRELAGRLDDAHAAAAAAGDGLDDHRVADVLGQLQRPVLVLDRAVAARQHRQTGLLHRPAGLGLVAEQPDHVRVGADEADVAGFAHLGQVGALGQEAVAGVDGVGAADLRGADDRRHVEIALAAARAADADVFVGEAHVQRVLVGLRIDGDGLDAQFAAREDDAQRDLPTVGDQDLLEHEALRRAGESRRCARRTAPAGRSRRRCWRFRRRTRCRFRSSASSLR